MSGQAAAVSAPVSAVRLTDELLQRFDRAARSSRLSDELFVRDTVNDLAVKLDTLLEAIRGVDLGDLLARHGWRHRLLGADLEARVRFSLAHRRSCEALSSAEQAARATALRVERLHAALATLQADQARLGHVVERADAIRARLAEPVTREAADLRARFERRYANLSSVRAANALALVQLPVDIDRYGELLDRFADVRGMLFPVWERHALSLAQSPDTPETVSQLRLAARALIDRLVDGHDGGRA